MINVFSIFLCQNNLHRHIRVHQKNNKGSIVMKLIETYEINYDKSNENRKPNVISNMISAKKQIQFKNNIE